MRTLAEIRPRPRLPGLILCCAAIVWCGSAGVALAADVPAGGRQLCAKCHDDLAAQLDGKVVHAPVAADSCTECHNPHAARHANLLREGAGELCFECHADVLEQRRRPVAHRALRDERSCLACHAPHAAEHAALLAAPQQELCVACHAEVGAKLVLDHPHAPAAGGECATCHPPHGAEQAGLLEASVPGLCQSCHQTDASLERAHRGFEIAKADCGSCHQPHGTAAAHLVRDAVHAPFEAGGCDTCHASPATPARLTQAVPDLCVACHADYGAASRTQANHPLTSEVSCVHCHSPHAGEPGGMLRGRERSICLDCHDAMRARVDAARSIHPVTVEGGRCTACHQPHDAAARPLLAAQPAAVCESCHSDHARFAHPMGPNVADPTRPGQGVGCLSCHDPHTSGERMLLVASPERALCVRCHKSLGG